ncbi:DAK2 domain-containing protein, partial [Tepidiforma sp.]|uniref:DAK2 domain-containing protein n=1 Tax=Tepidiforma sp. TaxID=2682230 RepID=UPI002ADDFD90
MTTAAPVHGHLDGAGLLALVEAGAAAVAADAEAINAINVYPVPDGDTGSNMAGTLREAVAEARARVAGATAGTVAGAVAKGALFGARGNSGVILSQALRGFAEALGPKTAAVDAAGLARALRGAADAAYRAVSAPKEGTMLTVLRRAAEAAEEAASEAPGTCLPVLRAAAAAAREAEAQTIEQLETLREAGVPDAGGEGVCVLLEAMLARLEGRDYAPPELPPLSQPSPGGPAREGEPDFGYCTEFVVEAAGAGAIDLGRLRALAEQFGTSVVVVGDAQAARVHAHTGDPERLAQQAAKLGTVSRLKVDDMTAQHARFRAGGSGATARTGLLAISRGAGFDAVFESLGAAVLDMGDVEKPAAGEIARLADALHTADVIVLPNHRNILLAAEQAAGLTRCTLHVVPTLSLPQGIAAALAFDPDAAVRDLLARMAEAAGRVKTVEVTTA